jgi:hypothetical protein
LTKTTLAFLLLAAVLIGTRLCHTGILWEGDTLPLAAAQQMADGKILYRDVFYDKPPLVPAFCLLWGARDGWPLRLGDALYCLLACWVAWRFAGDLWSRREGFWAAGLLAFFLIFDVPSAAVWLAWKRRPFWSGVLAGVAFWVSPKGLLVAAVCVMWNPSGALWIATGFAAVSGVAVVAMAATGALVPYWDEVWKWGRLYAESTFVADPVRNGLVRTLNWMGFHAAAVIAAARFAWARPRQPRLLAWAGWLVVALAGVAAGLRFFPRYYFMLLPVVVMMASRGFTLLGRKRELVALLLLIPATRFGPSYVAALTEPSWRDIGMDRGSRAAAALVRGMAHQGDTLLVWGYRPEIFVYTGLRAGTPFLDSQPLTGVPADRHLTQSQPVETEAPARRRARLAESAPTFVLDGLGPLNPALAISNYPDLRSWLSQYREAGQAGGVVIYRRVSPAVR